MSIWKFSIQNTQMLILSDDDDSIGHIHFDFIMVVPVIGVSQVIHIVVVLARRSDALRYTHLLADVLHVVTLLEYGILLKSI